MSSASTPSRTRRLARPRRTGGTPRRRIRSSDGWDSESSAVSSPVAVRRRGRGREEVIAGPVGGLCDFSFEVYGSFCKGIGTAFRIVLMLLMKILGMAIVPVLTIALIAIPILAIISGLSFYLYGNFSTIIANSTLPMKALVTASWLTGQALTPLTLVWCAATGLGCAGDPVQVASIARSVSSQAQEAYDLFGSVVALAHPSSMNMHHTQIWELAVAVKTASALEGKNELADELLELGNLARDLKDSMIGLNSQTVNTFSWIVRQFERVQRMVDVMQNPGMHSTVYTREQIERSLESMMTTFQRNMDKLIEDTERTIVYADRASSLGGLVLLDFAESSSRQRQDSNELHIWTKIKNMASSKGALLREDMAKTTETVKSVGNFRIAMEDVRHTLIGFRDNSGWFKAGFIGTQLGTDDLSVEDEIYTLASTMEKFKSSVDNAKSIRKA